jgi:hypothetical protein
MVQWKNNKFCFKLSKMPTENYEMFHIVCGDETLSRSRVFEWFKQFKEVREGLKCDPRKECPSTSRNADTIANVWNGDHRSSTGRQNDGGTIIQQQGGISLNPPWRFTEEESMVKVRPTQTQRQAEVTEAHIVPRLHEVLSGQSQFSLLHFSRC